MATPDNDKVTLLIDGKAHSDWERYDIDNDLLTPADGWQVSLGMGDRKVPQGVTLGSPVKVLIGDELVLTGVVEDIDHPVRKGAHNFSLSGRDLAGDLLDCAAPIFNARQVSLAQAANKITSLFGIKAPRIDADATRTREKITVEPGDSAWDVLERVAEANGLWPWFEPDGTLVIGGPDYTTPIVATLILRKDGKGNNVESLGKRESMRGRHSKVTVYGQAPGTETEQGRHSLQGAAEDTGVTRYRPKIVVDHECDSPAMCRDRANKIISDGRLNGLTLSAEVKGHRIIAPGQPSDGVLWKQMQRVHVISEPHEVDGVFFVMGRRFIRNRQDGTRTVLTIKEDGMWLVNAHPHKKAHRLGKNAMPGKIIDVSGGAQ